MSELKPFGLLPYGTQFRYQGTPDVWVRTQHNVVAEWPGRLRTPTNEPIQSLCCFCHLDGDEDGNTLDTLVEVVDQEAALRDEIGAVKGEYDRAVNKLAALREALEHIEKTCGQSRTVTRRLRWIAKRAELALAGRPYVATEHELPVKVEAEHFKLLRHKAELKERLTAAEQRNAEVSASVQLAAKLLDQTLAALNPTAKLAKNIREFLDAQRTKPTESGASE